MSNAISRRIAIDPVSRIEGEAKITILLDDDRQVREARLHVVEFRGFERFIRGRPYWEVPVIVERLCGICPVSHHLASAKALDAVVGAKVPPTADKLRRLMHYGQIIQSHATHFFHLASPDLMLPRAAAPERNIFEVLRTYPELGRQAVLLRQYGQELIRIVGGKRIHPTGAVPGGVNKSLTREQRDRYRARNDEVKEWTRRAVKLARDFTLEHWDELKAVDSWPSSHMSLVRPDGALELYDGRLRAVSAKGERVFDGALASDYPQLIREEVRPWSYMKFPYLASLGSTEGWYRVGALARLNTCDFIDTPEAESARREYVQGVGGLPCNVSMAYHWARMIEMLHAVEKSGALLDDPELEGHDLVDRGARQPSGTGVIEAPRGTLIHYYEVDEHDQVRIANLIVATVQNNEPMNRAVLGAARRHLNGKSEAEVTEPLLNQIETALRAYDPCLSCATHAAGRMALAVTILDGEGRVLAKGGRS